LALLLAIFLLPESLHAGSEKAGRKLLDWAGLRAAAAVPSVGMLLVAIFVCVFSFANFETTLSMLIKDSPFQFDWGRICLTYAFIGLTLALVQGGLVRRISGKVSEGTLAATGALIEIVGFALMVWATMAASVAWLFVALAVVVIGFAFMQPNLNALLSRRSDPAQQGMILGVGQSVNSLARIFGAGLGIPMLQYQLTLPHYVAAGLMTLGLLLVVIAARTGRDYAKEN
jgi:predicted MFS family arabinose efflux permease